MDAGGNSKALGTSQYRTNIKEHQIQVMSNLSFLIFEDKRNLIRNIRRCTLTPCLYIKNNLWYYVMSIRNMEEPNMWSIKFSLLCYNQSSMYKNVVFQRFLYKLCIWNLGCIGNNVFTGIVPLSYLLKPKCLVHSKAKGSMTLVKYHHLESYFLKSKINQRATWKACLFLCFENNVWELLLSSHGTVSTEIFPVPHL